MLVMEKALLMLFLVVIISLVKIQYGIFSLINLLPTVVVNRINITTRGEVGTYLVNEAFIYIGDRFKINIRINNLFMVIFVSAIKVKFNCQKM